MTKSSFSRTSDRRRTPRARSWASWSWTTSSRGSTVVGRSHRCRRHRGRGIQHLKRREAPALDLDRSIVETLSNVSTATITTILLKKGLRNVWMRGTRPLQPGQPRRGGRAFTRRFGPTPEDLATPESWDSPKSTRAAIEPTPDRCLEVVEPRAGAAAGGRYEV